MTDRLQSLYAEASLLTKRIIARKRLVSLRTARYLHMGIATPLEQRDVTWREIERLNFELAAVKRGIEIERRRNVAGACNADYQSLLLAHLMQLVECHGHHGLLTEARKLTKEQLKRKETTWI